MKLEQSLGKPFTSATAGSQWHRRAQLAERAPREYAAIRKEHATPWQVEWSFAISSPEFHQRGIEHQMLT
jgi:hypothetical protein